MRQDRDQVGALASAHSCVDEDSMKVTAGAPSRVRACTRRRRVPVSVRARPVSVHARVHARLPASLRARDQGTGARRTLMRARRRGSVRRRRPRGTRTVPAGAGAGHSAACRALAEPGRLAVSSKLAVGGERAECKLAVSGELAASGSEPELAAAGAIAARNPAASSPLGACCKRRACC